MRGYRFAVLRAGARSVYVTETERETERCATEMRVHPTELRGKVTGISAKRETESRIAPIGCATRSEREPCIAKRVCPSRVYP